MQGFLIVTFFPGLINARVEVRAGEQTETVLFNYLFYKDIKSNEDITEIDIEFSCSLGTFCEFISLIISRQLLLKNTG